VITHDAHIFSDFEFVHGSGLAAFADKSSVTGFRNEAATKVLPRSCNQSVATQVGNTVITFSDTIITASWLGALAST